MRRLWSWFIGAFDPPHRTEVCQRIVDLPPAILPAKPKPQPSTARVLVLKIRRRA
jgi:hypothetical protein